MKKLLMMLGVVAACSLGAAERPKLVLHMDFNTAQRTKDAVVSLLREAASFGYNAVLWEIEDKVHWDVPGIAAADAFSKEEFREILTEADRLGLEPIPLFQIFGHAEYILSKPPYLDLREKAEAPDCYCVSNPKTFEFQKRLLAEYVDLFGPKAKWFHLGSDEAYDFGKCETCSKRDKLELYLEHLGRAANFLAGKGIRTCVWNDMICGKGKAVADNRYVVWIWDYDCGADPNQKAKCLDEIPWLQEKGFDVVYCGSTSSSGDGPFLPDMKKHRANLDYCAALARERNLSGFCVTSWTIRQHLRTLQLPLFRFAAKRFLDPSPTADEDWQAALAVTPGIGLSADDLDAASFWNWTLSEMDGRAFGKYKNAQVPTPEQFRTKLDWLRQKNLLPDEELIRPIATALAKGEKSGTGVWQEAYRLERTTLKAIDDVSRGRPVGPLPTDEAVKHLAREQSPLSAARSAAIIWGYYPRRSVQELGKAKTDNMVGFGNWNRYYLDYYVNQVSDGEVRLLRNRVFAGQGHIAVRGAQALQRTNAHERGRRVNCGQLHRHKKERVEIR